MIRSNKNTESKIIIGSLLKPVEILSAWATLTLLLLLEMIVELVVTNAHKRTHPSSISVVHAARKNGMWTHLGDLMLLSSEPTAFLGPFVFFS